MDQIARSRPAARGAGRAELRAWRPAVEGIAEVLHARFADHAYPAHTHDTWTLLIVDDGAIRYDLDRHPHGAVGSTVTLLPPHVPHDGTSAGRHGFRKRVLYLDSAALETDMIGAAVDHPGLGDPLLRHRIHQLHGCLDHPGDALEAESRLALIQRRLRHHLRGQRSGRQPSGETGPRPGAQLAGDLRDLREAARQLHAHPAHLVRSFTATFGLPPHVYLTGRRVDLARRLLLAGRRPADVATAAGFYDQSHLSRHFTRYLGTSPGRYATGQDTRP